MIFEFLIKCNDKLNDFSLTILIDENQTFLDLHNSIQLYSEFDAKQMASFFISSDIWDKQQEITLLEIDKKIPYMKNTKINTYIKTKNDKLIYLFDFFSDRSFKIELTNILEKTKIKKMPTCSNITGIAPKQIIIDDDFITDFDEELDNNQNFKNIDDLDI